MPAIVFKSEVTEASETTRCYGSWTTISSGKLDQNIPGLPLALVPGPLVQCRMTQHGLLKSGKDLMSFIDMWWPEVTVV